jgi:hypothetical protein
MAGLPPQVKYQQDAGLNFQDVRTSLVSGSVPAPTAGELDEPSLSEARFFDGSPSLSDMFWLACHWPRSEASHRLLISKAGSLPTDSADESYSLLRLIIS